MFIPQYSFVLQQLFYSYLLATVSENWKSYFLFYSPRVSMATVNTAGKLLTTAIILLIHISGHYSQSLIHLKSETYGSGHYGRIRLPDDLFCDSWRFTVETNDAGGWSRIPERCVSFVQDYMSGDRYMSDSEFVAGDSIKFAQTVKLAGDGKDAWVFDIDETLLSNLPYYQAHGFGSEIFDESTFNDWVDLAEAPAIPASLTLYKELQDLGFTLFLLTGRNEFQRNVTVKNLLYSGYTNFERLLLRGPSDVGTPAIVYKSDKRKELEAEGYRIHGSSGDQWSDLLGHAIAQRSFKLPNPMYFIA